VLKLKEVFDDADKDGSGEIEANELQQSLKKTNLGEEAVNMFKSMDRDGSKKIDFSEYLRAGWGERAAEGGGWRVILLRSLGLWGLVGAH
jgi:hypothetical protein